MRNLKVTSCKVLPPVELIKGAQCFCLDCDTGVLWVATRNNICYIDKEICVASSLSDHMTSHERVVGMEYLMDVESLCLALSGGNIMMFNIATSELESVGEVEDLGVGCMEWSPEQDLVVMVTGGDKLMLMTKDFDLLTETRLHQEEFGVAKPVTVGWGKKETQFHGSEGKPKPGDIQKKVVQPALPWDDKCTRLSWRGDGEYFACSVVDPSSGSRMIRIWSRECVLHATCDVINGLQQPLAWKPSGNLLAGLQLKPHRNDVVFFELNGLQHGEFPFQAMPTDLQVMELLWSCDSSVLCAWCVRVEGGEETVQLWTVGNYHWYLKQEIHFADSEAGSNGKFTTLVGLLWDPMTPLKLHLLTSEGQYLCYTWQWTVSESKCHTATNASALAVIDGNQILYTPFRFAIVPPPMSFSQFRLPSPANEIAFSPPPFCNDFMVVMPGFQVAVFSTGPTERAAAIEPVPKHPVPQLIGITRIEGVRNAFHALRQFVWWCADSLLAIAVEDGTGVSTSDPMGECGRESIILFSLLIDRKTKCVKLQKRCSVSVPGPVLCLYSNPDTKTAVVQLTSGEVLRWDGMGNKQLPFLSPWLLGSGRPLKFEQQCDKIELALFNGKERVVGHCKTRNKLYIDDLEMTSSCTSFAVHDDYLLFITNTHFCRFVSLRSDPNVLEALEPLKADKLCLSDASIRRVERGSRIVTIISGDTRLVLQMPRGNLEMMCPRALTLADIRRKLDRQEFGEAFRSIRKNRINFNLIHDHNPQAFFENVSKFVKQLETVTNINLFLAALKEEDVCKTMYLTDSTSTTVEHGTLQTEGEMTSKLDRVCNAVREELMRCGENRYLLSIITTYIKMTHSQVETVLCKIQKLKEFEAKSSSSSCSESNNSVGNVMAVDALKYTAFLVDVNRLYNIALGMYDLPLVVMVAEKSQKDPKEYLPFLNQLKKLPLNYQRYKIDCHLKRYDKALHHIAKCGPDKLEECMSLINAHSLYKEALAIYDRGSEDYKVIASAYGHHLNTSGKHKDAGLIFSQCGCHQDALEAFEKAGCWEQVFVAASLLHYTEPQKIEAGRRIAQSLKSNRRYSEACRVLLDYVSDPEEAIAALVEGCCWDEALRLVHFHHRLDLQDTHLLPGLLEAREAQLSLLQTFKDDFLHHSSRLVVVRENKRKKQEAILEGTYAADEKDADLFSDTSSYTGRSAMSSTNISFQASSSRFSKTTGRSSKSRKKAARKRHNLREGSQYEEEALVEALAEIVTTSDRAREEMNKMLASLVQFGYSKLASVLQEQYEDLLESMGKEMDTIWPQSGTHRAMESASIPVLGPGATVNSILAARATNKEPESITYAGVAAPKLRENVKWKLAL